MKSGLGIGHGRRARAELLCLVAVLGLAGPAAITAQPAVDPSINAPYENPDIGYWRGVFENDRREIYAHRFEILSALGLQPGMTVADIGAGTGFFALMFAAEVGSDGRVYAVDISDRFVAAIDQRAAAAGFTNIVAIVNEPRDAKLPADSIDLAFISDTYHHFEYPRDMLGSLREALKPGGALVIVDFRRVPGISSPWVLDHVRAGAGTVRAEVEAAGFQLVEQRDFMRGQYYLRFRKTAAEAGAAAQEPAAPSTSGSTTP